MCVGSMSVSLSYWQGGIAHITCHNTHTLSLSAPTGLELATWFYGEHNNTTAFLYISQSYA